MAAIVKTSSSQSEADSPPVTLHLGMALKLTADQLLELSSLNRDLRLELTAEGDLIIMPPVGGETGQRNAEITGQLRDWAKRDGIGLVFDSSTGFRLPNGAVLSPDAAWLRRERWDALTPEQRAKYPPLCPDFVVELPCPSDRLRTLQRKMQEYIDNGAQLGWLIDVETWRVYVYRPGAKVDVLEQPREVSGEPALPGFRLEMEGIW